MEQNTQSDYVVTLDRSLMHVREIHHWLSTKSYWAAGIPFEVVQRAFDHSFVAGVIMSGRQIGFARLITDYAVFAYLADVYVEEGHRGKGLGKAMIALMMEQPWVKELRRITLATKDAHSLYKQYGFTELQYPHRMMEILRPGLYQQNNSSTYELS